MGRKSKDSKKGSENGSLAPETEEKYPYYVFFILGNEFCERYAYYGMRSILVIYLVSYTNFQGPTSVRVDKNFPYFIVSGPLESEVKNFLSS